MINIPLASLVQWILHYKYAVLFPIMVVEGPIATVIGGFLASLGYLNIFAVFGLAVLGDTVGDLIYYVIGYSGRKRFLSKGSFLGINKERMAAIEKHYDLHAGKTFILGKITHTFGFAVLLSAGIAGVPLWTYIWFNFLGTLPKVVVFEIIGYYFGANYQKINNLISDASIIVFIVGIIVLGAILYLRRRNKNL